MGAESLNKVKSWHNVSQSDTSKYRVVTRDVAIVAGKDCRKINTSHKDKFIKSNESSC